VTGFLEEAWRERDPPSLRGGGLDWLIPEGGEDPVLGQEGLQKRR